MPYPDPNPNPNPNRNCDFQAGDHSYVYAHVLRQTLEVILRNATRAPSSYPNPSLQVLRHNKGCVVEGSDGGVDLLRVESLLNLGKEKMARVLQHNYALLLSLTPFAPDSLSLTVDASPLHIGPVSPIIHSPWLRLWLYQSCGKGPLSLLYPRGSSFRRLPSLVLEGT